MNKILESFNNLNDQARYCLLVVAVFSVILADVLLLVLPQMGNLASINDRIKKMSDDTRQVLVDRGRIKLLKKNLQTVRDQYGALSVKVRPTQEVPAILSTISSIANEYGVNIDQLVPEKDQQEALKSSPDGKYYALPIVMKAHGGYHMFGRFLSKLENEDMCFIVKDFIIQNDDKDPRSRLFSLTIKMVLVDRALAPSKSL